MAGTKPEPNAGRSGGGATNALRREAERRWAQADRAASAGARRSEKNAQARETRREAARGKDDEIARLKGKLEAARREAARHRRPKGKDGAGR